MKKELPPHPSQPVFEDASGKLYFRVNAIVRGLFDRDGGDLSRIAMIGVPPEDHVQFAQLLGIAVEKLGAHSGAIARLTRARAGHAPVDPHFEALRVDLPKAVPTKKTKSYNPQLMQPVHEDAHGVFRFRKNVIVDALVDRDEERGRVYPDFPARTDGGMNWICAQDFAREDEEQLAQLVGYSVSGYCGMTYVSDESAARAGKLSDALLAADGKERK